MLPKLVVMQFSNGGYANTQAYILSNMIYIPQIKKTVSE